MEKFIEEKDLQRISLEREDGTTAEYILANEGVSVKSWYRFAHLNRLQCRVLVKDSDKSDQWMLTPYFAKRRIYMENIIREYFKDEYMYVDLYLSYLNEYADKFISHAPSNSPVEVAKAMDEVEAVKKMFKEEKIGYEKPRSLVMDKECTQHIIVSEHPLINSFKNITMVLALTEPEANSAETALALIKAGKNVPDIPGMYPEDVCKIVDEETKKKYDLRMLMPEYDDDNWQIGPFVVQDNDGFIGYAYRTSYDGQIWYWADGEHTNISLPEGLDDWRSLSPEVIWEKLYEDYIIAWMAPICETETDEYGNLLKL